MDTFTAEKRSAVMAAIRSKDTNPEMAVRSIAHRLGYRFRLHRRDLPGTPDLVFPARKSVLFVHGCFWHQHGCKKSRPPKSRVDYWSAKLERNVTRDGANRATLSAAGWKVGVVWECESKDSARVASILHDLFATTADPLGDAMPTPQPRASTGEQRSPEPS